MTETSMNKVPMWFWVVVVLCLIWNLLGVMTYVAQVNLTPEAIQAMSEAERHLHETVPAWATGAFAVAVFGGALGCLTLLLRQRWAVVILSLSLVGVLVQMSHSFFVSKSWEVYGPGPGLVMPMVIILVAIFLIWLARFSGRKGWLR